MKHIIIISLIALILLPACRQQIPIKSKVKGNFVVYSELQPGAVAEIYLTEEATYYQYIEKEGTVSFIRDANVSISGNGQTDVLELTSKQDTFGGGWGVPVYTTVYYYKGHFPLVSGEKYTLSASREKKSISAETTLPGPIALKSLKITEEIANGQTYTRYFALFDDAKEGEDFYRVNSCYELPDTAGVLQWYCNDDYSFNYPVTDKFFSNYEGQMELVNLPIGFSDSVLCRLRLQRCNKDWGDYLSSVQEQSNIGNNPFVEPTLLKSNIKGDGIGVFGGYTSSTDFFFKVK